MRRLERSLTDDRSQLGRASVAGQPSRLIVVQKTSMNLVNTKPALAACVAAAILMLQGCAGTTALKDTTNSLSVHQDNRISYVMQSNSTSESVRAWSATQDILAIRVNNRLINSKDIDWIDIRQTRERHTPLTITVALQSGEKVTTPFANWGSDQHIEGKVEWVACTVDKKCEYVSRGTSQLRFDGFPELLTGTSSARIELAARNLVHGMGRASQAQGSLTINELRSLLPSGQGGYQMKFQRFDQLPTSQELLQDGVKRQKAFDQCVDKYMVEFKRRNHEGEAEIRRSYSGAELTRMLGLWATSISSAGQLSESEMHCRSALKAE